MKILILGASGMLGHVIHRVFAEDNNFDTFATARNHLEVSGWPAKLKKQVIESVDVLDDQSLDNVFNEVRPDFVINCVGLIKQLQAGNDPLEAIPINSMLPHRLARLSEKFKARLLLMSTDCVFDGKEGNYRELDDTNAQDLYGRTKILGEVVDKDHVVTLRTSIIGHELSSNNSLVDWFLTQKKVVKGFRQVIYSGLPTIEFASIVKNVIVANKNLKGLYHISSQPISKFELLKLVASQYSKKIEILPVDEPVLDRSLNSTIFTEATGYIAPSWSDMIAKMHENYMEWGEKVNV